LPPSGAIFDLDSARNSLQEIEKQISAPGFWDNPQAAQDVGRKRSRIEKRLTLGESLNTKSEELDVLLELERDGENVDADIEALVSQLESEVTQIEMTMKLSGEHDDRDAIVAIHPGAGGTESQDWAEMLLRMYLRFAERRGWTTETVEYQAGDEAGIKSATMMVRGDYAYGYLKSEHGVHRLVRISPFDAAKRRHTSFASVYVYPDIDEDIEIEINDKDLRVVTCQNERSQHKNRDTAMKLLRARLYQLEVDKRQAEQEKLEGEKKDIAFGSQIRSYVLQPYQLAKDLRTGHEVGDVQRVLDGDLDSFVEAYLAQRARTSADE
jgi:peptide chain release factor 2